MITKKKLVKMSRHNLECKMNIKNLESQLKSAFEVCEIKCGLLVNSAFMNSLNMQDMPVAVIISKDENARLSDMGLTHKCLEEAGISLNDKQLGEYINRIFSKYDIALNEKNEIIKTILNEDNAIMALTGFLQALILLNNLPLLFE